MLLQTCSAFLPVSSAAAVDRLPNLQPIKPSVTCQCQRDCSSPIPHGDSPERLLSLRFGISPALVTPFSEDGVDVRRLADHAKDCIARGCRTATIFGTTGEGP